MAHAKADSDYYRLNSTDRLLALSGVPIRVLKKKIQPKNFSFCQVSCKVNDHVQILPADRQHSYFMQTVQNIEEFGSGGVVAVGSAPTENPCYEFATFLCREYYVAIEARRQLPHIRWIDLGSANWDYLKEESTNDIVVISGISDNSENRRIEQARDFLSHQDSATKILLAATTNILEFCNSKIHRTPDAAFQLIKTAARVV